MFELFKKKKTKNETAVISANYVKQIVEELKELQMSSEKANKEACKAMNNNNKVEKSVEINSDSIAQLSQAIASLTSTMTSLVVRVKAIEDVISVNNIKFKKRDLV